MDRLEIFMDDRYYMQIALQEADLAMEADEVPVGAVVVAGGEIIASAHNEKETLKTATAHAEMKALERAAAAVGSWHLEECTLYVTMEPCAMCAGAMLNARVSRLVFGAYDKRFGCCGSIMNLLEDKRFNHTVTVTGGVLEKECGDILTDFFKKKRAAKKDTSKSADNSTK